MYRKPATSFLTAKANQNYEQIVRVVERKWTTKGAIVLIYGYLFRWSGFIYVIENNSIPQRAVGSGWDETAEKTQC